MKIYCLMLKYTDSNRSGYHSVYTNEGTARKQLHLRLMNAEQNMTYYLEEKSTPPLSVVNGTVRFPDSNGALILDTRQTDDTAFVQNLLTGKPL